MKHGYCKITEVEDPSHALRRIASVLEGPCIQYGDFVETASKRSIKNSEEEAGGVEEKLEAMDCSRCIKRMYEGVMEGKKP